MSYICHRQTLSELTWQMSIIECNIVVQGFMCMHLHLLFPLLLKKIIIMFNRMKCLYVYIM